MGLFKRKNKSSKTTNEYKGLRKRTSGLVLEINRSSTQKATLKIKYAVGDQKFFIDETITAPEEKLALLDAGDIISVLYNPNKPTDAIIESIDEL